MWFCRAKRLLEMKPAISLCLLMMAQQVVTMPAQQKTLTSMNTFQYRSAKMKQAGRTTARGAVATVGLAPAAVGAATVGVVTSPGRVGYKAYQGSKKGEGVSSGIKEVGHAIQRPLIAAGVATAGTAAMGYTTLRSAGDVIKHGVGAIKDKFVYRHQSPEQRADRHEQNAKKFANSQAKREAAYKEAGSTKQIFKYFSGLSSKQ